MKRRNAIILFGALTLMCAGYVAWCGRCFYLKKELVLSSGTSPEVVSTLEDWRARTHVDLRARFTREKFVRHLVHPFSKDDRKLRVSVVHNTRKHHWIVHVGGTRGTFRAHLFEEKENPVEGWQETYHPFVHMCPPGYDSLDGAYQKFPFKSEESTPLPPDAEDQAWEIIHAISQ